MNTGHIRAERAAHEARPKPQGPQIVTRQCSDQDQANAAYLKLCDQYDSVQLLRAPFFGSGTYAWQVERPI